MRLSLLFLGSLLCVWAQIGQRTFTFNDPSRTGGFGSGGGPGRQIQTEVYYPATSDGTNTPIRPGSYPVVVIGHGFVMVWSAYQNLWEALVPAGYIVALPRTEGSFSPSHQDFALDLRIVGERLIAEGQNPTSPFYGHVHPRVALTGHSMGGGASILAAAGYSNAHCVVGFAAANTNPSAITAAAQVTLPTLILAGSGDAVTPPSQHQIPIYNALASSCKYYASITGGGHCYFANPNTNCDFGETTSGSQITITRAQQQALTARLLRPFLDAYLKDSCLQRFHDTLTSLSGITYQMSCTYQPLTLSGSPTNPTQSNPQGGSITLSVTGGTPPYSYSWSHGYTGASPTGLGPGSYTVTVRDAQGCTAVETYILSLVTALTLPSGETVRVYPTLFQETLWIELPDAALNLPITVSDAGGKVVWIGKSSDTRLRIDTHAWPGGTYRLSIGSTSFTVLKIP